MEGLFLSVCLSRTELVGSSSWVNCFCGLGKVETPPPSRRTARTAGTWRSFCETVGPDHGGTVARQDDCFRVSWVYPSVVETVLRVYPSSGFEDGGSQVL